MMHLLITIISFYSLVLLIMPATTYGVIETFSLLVLIPIIVVFNKRKNIVIKATKVSVIFVLTITIYFGISFYNRWIYSTAIKNLADIFCISNMLFVSIVAVLLSLLSTYIINLIINQVLNYVNLSNEEYSFKRNITISAIYSAIIIAISQIMINEFVFSMGIIKFVLGMLLVFVIILALYGLFARIKIAVILSGCFILIISTINAYVYSFRGRLFELIDLFSVQTAINVTDNYSLWPIPSGVAIGWLLWIVSLIVITFGFKKYEIRFSLKNRIIILLSCLIGLCAIFFCSVNMNTYHWNKEGATFNGYVLDFVSKAQDLHIAKPQGYNLDNISDLVSEYKIIETKINNNKELPHIIVVMDEAFSDLEIYGDLSTNKEIMPFISSLNNDVIKGYALTSVYGGNTANSEYEFLTGNTMAWLPMNAVPYQQYIKSSTYSLASNLKNNYKYRCIAMHPYLSSGWNRPNAYCNLGFDESLFIESFPQEKYIRNYISDQEMFEQIVTIYEKQKHNPLFLFGVSMQNHGGYKNNGVNYDKTITLNSEMKYPETEQYLSLINETDKAIEYLISYFEKVDEDVIIVFFGDHQPKLNDGFFDNKVNNDTEVLDNQQKKYKVPFFIWTNYDIEEKYIDCTSLNYLSTYVYEAAGINLPPYNQFLSEMESMIPSINSYGFYSIKSQCYLPFDEASNEEKEWLETYKQLQYNSTFDKNNRNEIFFPILQ